ncbi:MAG: hypothetical protein Q3M30_06815 [Candidatus Electrothrix sp. Rat3]|nr:hypothetical protein [Candidatus Electrothrix rattekaaiensis]
MYKFDNQTINFVTITHITIQIKTKDHNIIKFGIKKGMFNKKDFAEAEKAYPVLYKLSFDSRVEYYLNELKTKKYIDYKFTSGHLYLPTSVRIYKDGTVEKGNKKVNLIKAKKDGFIIIGTSIDIPLRYQSYNPNEIAISEKPKSRYGFTLRINATWDTEIIKQIITLLSEGKRIV